MYHPVDVSASAYTGVPLEPPAPLDETRATAEIIAAQSQDYVDEKLAEYQATIYLLQGESILPAVILIPDVHWGSTNKLNINAIVKVIRYGTSRQKKNWLALPEQVNTPQKKSLSITDWNDRVKKVWAARPIIL